MTLHEASRSGNLEVDNLLLENGAEIDALDVCPHDFIRFPSMIHSCLAQEALA